jgi:hypothetical protein
VILSDSALEASGLRSKLHLDEFVLERTLRRGVVREVRIIELENFCHAA